jgi:hypothetical protein
VDAVVGFTVSRERELPKILREKWAKPRYVSIETIDEELQGILKMGRKPHSSRHLRKKHRL